MKELIKNPHEDRYGGSALSKIIDDEKKLPFETKLKNAKGKINDIINRDNFSEIKTLAKDLLDRHPISSLEMMPEETLDKEAGEYCTGMELLAVCDYLYEKTN